MKKRSITIAGHATSISLEEEFWTELKRIGKARGLSLNRLVTLIDEQKQPGINLSSAIRLYVLADLKG